MRLVKMTVGMMLFIILFSLVTTNNDVGSSLNFDDETMDMDETEDTDFNDTKTWDPNLPTLKIGDYFVKSKKDLQEYEKTHKVFIVGVSDSSCEKCWYGEIILGELNELFINKKLAYKGKPIPIVRIDLKYFGRLKIISF